MKSASHALIYPNVCQYSCIAEVWMAGWAHKLVHLPRLFLSPRMCQEGDLSIEIKAWQTSFQKISLSSQFWWATWYCQKSRWLSKILGHWYHEWPHYIGHIHMHNLYFYKLAVEDWLRDIKYTVTYEALPQSGIEVCMHANVSYMLTSFPLNQVINLSTIPCWFIFNLGRSAGTSMTSHSS